MMNKFQSILLRFRKIVLPDGAALLLIFLVSFFSFGLLLSRLGFFQDDWHHVFYAYEQGVPGLKRFLFVDSRPFAYIVYAFFFRVLGFLPARWHWSLMILRFLTTVLFWLSVRQIWPGQNRLTGWMALLFAIYPVFGLQPLSVAYTLHWAMYVVSMLSVWLMLYAVRNPKWYIFLTALAVLLQSGQLVIIEYFAGLELSRIIFLWFLFPTLTFRERAKKVLRCALPFLITFALYVIYRSSYSTLFGYDRFEPLSVLRNLFTSPLSTLTSLIQYILQDFSYIVFSPWFSAIDPAVIDLFRPSTYVIIGSAAGFAVLAFLLMSHLRHAEEDDASAGIAARAIFGGISSILLAMLPFWLTGFSVYQKNQLWSGRLALAVMGGASMMMVGIIYTLIARPRYRNLVLSLLLGLGVSLQVQTARSYQASWDKQRALYWQFYWRMPSLEPNTMIVADQEILFFMGYYPTAFAINLLYPQVTEPPLASYWFNAGSEHINWDTFGAGQPVTLNKYVTTFNASVQNVVAITFQPEQGQCLWALQPEYKDARGLTEQAYLWMAVSNLSRIRPVASSAPPPEIFGSEPPRNWCYFYEKADLASQYKDWPTIDRLWKESNQKNLSSSNGFELLPFVRGYGMMGDWQTARSITFQASTLPDRPKSLLCDVWRELDSTAPPSPERGQTVSLVNERLGCQK